ncbi:cbb3-type cytochrome oxidase assembly protein CcoS [Pleomorphomonas koreensis]|uniref:cbb3-type cytochrome oxidase assembly protein CcoS n=1 Tax=Pleomorphomonas koreensis TaxID=257440 RepID=UPI00041FF2A2|nr:cbb3-type cytochrome oxidase assembly protein CcoS [Pleomorphomonas koreensis]
MSVLVYLVPAALLLGLIGLAGFMWSLKSGQYDDLEGAAWRILEDDDIEEPEGGESARGRVPEGEERRKG